MLIFLSHICINDSLDAIHVSRVLDPKYDRPSIQHLLATQARESARRLQQSATFEAELNTYEPDMDDYMARCSADLRIIEEEAASPAKDQRIQDHLANQAAIRQAHPEPVERAEPSSASCHPVTAH